MSRIAALSAILITLLLLQGCASSPADPASRILGSWSSSVGGFDVTTVYTASGVSVDGHAALPYSLDGDRLVIAGDSHTLRVVSFPSSSEMVQRDPVTRTDHVFTRISN